MTRQHWMTAVLLVSLALNLLVAGAVIGRWSRGDFDRPPPLEWAVKDLDSGTREAVRPLLRRSLSDTREMRTQLREASEDVRRLITADPLDEAALRASLERLREVSSRYQAQVHDTAVLTLRELDPGQRRRMAGHLLRPEHHPPPRMHSKPRQPPVSAPVPEPAPERVPGEAR